MTVSERLEVLCQQDRNAGPQTLFIWWIMGELSPTDLRSLLPTVWTMVEWPHGSVGLRDWLGMFREAGFVTDDESTVAPTEPLTVWRGATRKRCKGMAWTLDRQKALWFADRDFNGFGFEDAVVYETTVPVEHVLAIFTGRNESEVVVNPNCLRGSAKPRVVDRPRVKQDYWLS